MPGPTRYATGQQARGYESVSLMSSVGRRRPVRAAARDGCEAGGGDYALRRADPSQLGVLLAVAAGEDKTRPACHSGVLGSLSEGRPFRASRELAAREGWLARGEGGRSNGSWLLRGNLRVGASLPPLHTLAPDLRPSRPPDNSQPGQHTR